MSRFLSLSHAAFRHLSAASITPISRSLNPSTHHSTFNFNQYSHLLHPPNPSAGRFSVPKKYYCTGAAAELKIGTTSYSAFPVSVTALGCGQLALLAYMSNAFFSSPRQHLEDIIDILLQIKNLLQKRFSRQCAQIFVLVYGILVSLFIPAIQAIIMAAEQGPTLCRLISAGGLMACFVLKLSWIKLIPPRQFYCRLPLILQL